MTDRLHDRWQKRILRDSKRADKIARRPVIEAEFLTEPWCNEQQTKQQNLCYHCEGFMDWIKRNKKTGLTAERLDNSLPHHRSNCVLACKSCNSRKLNYKQHLLRKYFFRWYRHVFDVKQQFTNRRCSLV